MILFAALFVWFVGWYLTSYFIYNVFGCFIDYPITLLCIFCWPALLIACFINSSFASNMFNPLEKSFIYLNKLFKIKS
jgi:hypothetical protein